MYCLTKYLKKIWKLISLDAYKFLYILFYLYFSLFIDFVTFYSSSVDLSYVVIYYRLISSGLLNKLLRCSNFSTILLQNIYTLSDIYYYVFQFVSLIERDIFFLLSFVWSSGSERKFVTPNYTVPGNEPWGKVASVLNFRSIEKERFEMAVVTKIITHTTRK